MFEDEELVHDEGEQDAEEPVDQVGNLVFHAERVVQQVEQDHVEDHSDHAPDGVKLEFVVGLSFHGVEFFFELGLRGGVVVLV